MFFFFLTSFLNVNHILHFNYFFYLIYLIVNLMMQRYELFLKNAN